MIKSLVLKNFHDIQQKRVFKKGQAHFCKSLKRAEQLVNAGYVKILEIEKQEKPEQDESELTLKELREKYPDIKAKTKKAFLEQL